MSNNNPSQEFTLEEIMREFGSITDEEPETPIQEDDGTAQSESENAEMTAEPSEAEAAAAASAEITVTDESPESDENEAAPEESVPGQAQEEIPVPEASEEEGNAASSDSAADDTIVVPAKELQEQAVTRDTIRLDNLHEVIAQATEANRQAALVQETEAQENTAAADDSATIVVGDLSELSGAEEAVGNPVTDDTIQVDNVSRISGAAPKEAYALTGEELPPPPIVFTPRSRLRELKQKLVAGPEKRYYDLTEIGLGRVQAAIFVNVLIVLLCAGATALFAMGMVMENRLRLMIFSQVLAMMVSATLGCYVLLDGIGDLFKGRFTLNAMLFITLVACSVDAVFCLKELRVPCCAAFSLEMTMALWNRCLRRHTEMSQMDTLRKAVRLDSVVKVPDYHNGKSGILRGEGQVEDFMDTYQQITGPERVQRFFALLSLLLCVGIAALAGIRHGVSMAVQIFATSLLVALPASVFVTLSRPADILQRRLRMVGTVICGWHGVKGLCGKAAFPLRDQDLFPLGATKLNGVKFFGDREPDETIAYACALVKAHKGGLEPVFDQLLKSRSGKVYEVENFKYYPAGGIGGEVNGEPILMGTSQFLQDMGVEIPEGTMVSQAVYCSIDGYFSAVFAISYNRMKSAAAGLVALCSYRKLFPVLLSDDFTITADFLRSKFGIKTKRFSFPGRDDRKTLAQIQADPEIPVLALTTQEGLASVTYAVSGARSLRTACKLGMIIHMIGGILGMLIMLALAYLGSVELLTPVNILLYQLVWMIPGLLITEWTRTV